MLAYNSTVIAALLKEDFPHRVGLLKVHRWVRAVFVGSFFVTLYSLFSFFASGYILGSGYQDVRRDRSEFRNFSLICLPFALLAAISTYLQFIYADFSKSL